MKVLYRLLVFMCLLFSACSGSEQITPDEPFYCCSQTVVCNNQELIKQDSTLTRSASFNYVYLIADNSDKLQIPVITNKDKSYINLCFSNQNGVLYAISEGHKININNKKSCILTTQPNNIILNIGAGQTPGGKPLYESSGDILRSDEFYFTKKYRNVYININGKQYNVTKNPSIDLDRLSCLLKVNFIITDLSDGLLIHELDTKYFEKKLGYVNEWEIQSFIFNFPTEFNILDRSYNNNKLLKVYDKSVLVDNLKHDAIQIKWGQPIILGRFTGIGKKDAEGTFIFPYDLNRCKLGFSIYYNGRRKLNPSSTILVPLEDLYIKSNIEQEISVVVDVDDVYEEFTSKSRGLGNIPYKLYYKKVR